MTNLVISRILSQYVEEASLIWLRRDFLVIQPHYRLEDLAKLDDQLEAHLDGIRIAYVENAAVVWAVCERELEWGQPGEIFTAAILAWESGDDAKIVRVLEAGATTYENSRALVSALAWLPYDSVAAYIAHLLVDDRANMRRVGLAATVVHRSDPGQPLIDALDDSDHQLRARALRAAGELRRADVLPQLRERLDDADESARLAAAWSVVLMAGDGDAGQILREFVETAGVGADRALQPVLRRMDVVAAVQWIDELALAADPHVRRSAVIGAGILGVPVTIPWLIEQMRIPTFARVAGESFSSITGADIADRELKEEWPDGFVAGPTDDPDDENVNMDPDENLPWPNRDAILQWWGENAGRFDMGTRYLLGQPMTEPWLQHVLRHGFQRQREAAALELAIRNPGQPLFNTRAPGHRQQRLLEVK